MKFCYLGQSASPEAVGHEVVDETYSSESGLLNTLVNAVIDRGSGVTVDAG